MSLELNSTIRNRSFFKLRISGKDYAKLQKESLDPVDGSVIILEKNIRNRDILMCINMSMYGNISDTSSPFSLPMMFQGEIREKKGLNPVYTNAITFPSTEESFGGYFAPLFWAGTSVPTTFVRPGYLLVRGPNFGENIIESSWLEIIIGEEKSV